MKRLKRSGAIALLVLLVLLVLIHAVSAGEDNVQQKVVASWRARERGCTSFRIKWKETQTFLQGSLSNPKTRKHPKGQVLPPETMETDAYFLLCADGEKLKETADAMEITETMDMKRQQETTAFNGEVNKSFRPSQIHDYPQGYIGDEKYLPGLNVYNLRPVLVPLRPFRYDKWGYFTDTALLSNYEAVISATRGDHKCIILRETTIKRPVYEELWLDPEREYIPLREVVFSRGKPVIQIDWEEYRREGFIWVPLAWRIQQLADGVKKSFRGKVMEVSVNQRMPPEEFEIEFPPGTWVIDRRSKDQYGTPSHYIVKESGKRMISREELNSKTYKQLIGSEQRFLRTWTLVVATSAVVILVIVLAYYRRKKYVLH